MKIKIKYYGNNKSVYNRLYKSRLFNMSEQGNVNDNMTIEEDTQCLFLQVDGNNARQIFLIQKAQLAILNTNAVLIVLGSNKHLYNYLRRRVFDVFDINSPAEQIETRIRFFLHHKELLTSSLDTDHVEFKIPIWKRIFDIVFASIALILLTPLFALTALFIRLESKGPVFYSSKRVGAGYKVFDFFKFRSMYPDADKRINELMSSGQYNKQAANKQKTIDINSSNNTTLFQDDGSISEAEHLAKKTEEEDRTFFKLNNDPRITKVGRIIRNTSIDELPQLVNVLKGDMSIVGNRPLPLYEAEKLTTDMWGERFLAPAGLTGLWQVSQRAKSNDMSSEDRKLLDIQYARHFNFLDDMVIILKTLPAMLQHENV